LQQRTISSKQLGQALSYSDAQVRKDLAYFGQFGHPGVGYRVEDMIRELRKILGTDKTWNVLLVGAGNLGRALMTYRGFLRKGFRLAAVFDADTAKHGRRFGELEIQPVSAIAHAVETLQIRMAMIAVPPESAQQVADMLVTAKVRGILNFAAVSLVVPPETYVQSVDLALQLEQLSFRMNLGQIAGTAP
jgi:redox-sensing transcriptional repressor